MYTRLPMHADTLSILMLSNYKAEIFLKSYYMKDPPPLQMSITYQFMYCIFVFFYCILHQSIILLILIEMAYHLYIFFKTFTMYMYQCVCAYKIQMHNISEIKWYKAVWNIFHPEVWELCIIYFIWKYFKSTGMFSFSENVRYVASFYW